MDAAPLQDLQALRARLARARERLDRLVRDLHEVDRELEGLAPERKQYGLVHAACSALGELAALGGAGLFWGERGLDGRSDEQLRIARGRLDAFTKRLAEIEQRREATVEELDRQQETTEILEDELFEAEREEEQRRLEWAIEREVGVLPARELVMPWMRGGEDDRRFRKLLAVTLLWSVMLGLWVPRIPLPLPEPWQPSEVPERLTRLIREVRPLPPRPLAQREPVPEETKPEPTEEKPRVAERVEPQPAPSSTPKQETGSKGILAFREKFSALAASRPTDRLGSRARIQSGEVASGQPQRSMLTTNTPGSSGGINLAALSRDVGGGGGGPIEGVKVARVASSIGGSGPAGAQGEAGRGRPTPGRTDEEIQIVFDRHKAALYRLYNRELRNDPTLRGQMVLRIRIEPNGSVSICELQNTDMKAPQLAAQVVDRVRSFDFGAKEGIAAVTILYPIDFLPAT